MMTAKQVTRIRRQLQEFVESFAPELGRSERRHWCGKYLKGLLKAAVANRLHPTLRRLEDHLAAAARPWSIPAAVSSIIHTWLADQVNFGAPT